MDRKNSFATLPDTPREFGFFIGGVWHDRGDREVMARMAPAYSRAVTHIALCTRADVDTAVAAARGALNARIWAGVDSAVRADVLRRAAAGIRANLEELAYWEMLESGKPITQARDEIAGGAGHYDFCAGLAQSMHGESYNNQGDAAFGIVTRQPVGVVGLITPWNFPFVILSERLPYVLASGNSVVIKPSEFTSATTLMMADILQEAGLPDGVYNVVTGIGAEVGQAISEHKGIDMVSFTGSTRTGEQVLKASTSNFKRVGLELGGKSPQIIFADADLDDAADGVAFGMCYNSGQCCVAGARILVQSQIAEQFEAMLVERLSRVRYGDCFDPETQVGAIVTPQHCDKIMGYIALGQMEGARLVCGGDTLKGREGLFVAPTVLSGVTNDMQVAREEIFGPVACMIRFDTVEQALEIANDSPYGLAASIWTKDIDKALITVRGVEAGRTWINTTISGGPGQPMGGFKQSGIGRDGGMLGVEEYTEVKSTHIALGKRSPWVK